MNTLREDNKELWESLHRACKHKTEELDIYLSKKRLFGSSDQPSLPGLSSKNDEFRIKIDDIEVLEDCNRKAEENLKIAQESLLSLKIQREKMRVAFY